MIAGNIKGLRACIEFCKKEKHRFLEFLRELEARFYAKEVGREKAKRALEQRLKGKSVKEHIAYYNDKIKKYQSDLRKVKSRHYGFLFVIIIAFLISIFLFYPFLTGFVLEDGNETFVDDNNASNNITEFNITSNISDIEIKTNESINITASLNITLNESVINKTTENITQEILKEFTIIEDGPKERIVIGKPVVWKKKVSKEKGEIAIDIPVIAENIMVKKQVSTITGEVISEESRAGLLSRFFQFLRRLFSRITGRIVQESPFHRALLGEEAGIYEIEYTLPAPGISEETAGNNKKVKVRGPDEVKYADVLTFTNINEIVKDKRFIHIYWSEEDRFIDFEASDKDNDEYIDYLEWNTPYLSNQTFEIIIEISKAEHLDENRVFVSDIYDEVKELDNVWSETIQNKEYIRVAFEKNLTSKRDISIYLRVIQGNPRIEVYELDGSEIVGELKNLDDNNYNSIFLTDLQGEQDVFDLLISGGSIEIEHIIDPQIYFEDCNDISDWTITGTSPWAAGSGGDRGWCVAQSTLTETNMTSSAINLNGAATANLTFIRSTRLSAGDYFRIYANSSVNDFVLIAEFTDTGNGNHEFALENFISLNSGVHLRAACRNNKANEKCRWDNINVTYTIPPNTPPQIIFISSISSVNLNEGITKDVIFNFTAEDGNGVSDLYDSSAQARAFKAGEQDRINSSCNLVESNSDNKTYECSIGMQYYDAAGVWNVSVNINDTNGNTGTNSSSFTVNLLRAISINPRSIEFPVVNPGNTNILALNFTNITNKGNYESSISITAYNLLGETTPSEFIDASNFRARTTIDVCTSGSVLSNSTGTAIVGSFLPRGPLLTGEIYYCLNLVPDVSVQKYFSAGWQITLLFAAFIPARKKRLRKEVEDFLSETGKEGYKIEEIKDIIDEKMQGIPISIFSGNIGMLEAVAKYMKENLNMRYCNISRILKRNERTIWASYNNVKNHKERLIEKGIRIPLSIFRKDLSIFESIVIYLKNKKQMRYSEIAKLLDRDQRNIWATYHRKVFKQH